MNNLWMYLITFSRSLKTNSLNQFALDEHIRYMMSLVGKKVSYDEHINLIVMADELGDIFYQGWRIYPDNTCMLVRYGGMHLTDWEYTDTNRYRYGYFDPEELRNHREYMRQLNEALRRRYE